MRVEKLQYCKNFTILSQFKLTLHLPLASKNKKSQDKELIFKLLTCQAKPNIETCGKLMLQILRQRIRLVVSFLSLTVPTKCVSMWQGVSLI